MLLCWLIISYWCGVGSDELGIRIIVYLVCKMLLCYEVLLLLKMKGYIKIW